MIETIFKHARKWQSPKRPVYFAFETAERGVFRCGAKGPGLWSAAQLQAWAVQIGAELRLVEHAAPAVAKTDWGCD